MTLITNTLKDIIIFIIINVIFKYFKSLNYYSVNTSN